MVKMLKHIFSWIMAIVFICLMILFTVLIYCGIAGKKLEGIIERFVNWNDRVLMG